MAVGPTNDNGLGPPSGVFATNPHPAFGGTPTEPLLPANHPNAPKPIPHNYVDRLMGLSTAHPWMPHQTVATLAALPASDQAVSQMAVTLRNLYGSVDNAVKYVTDDPLLQKTPSLGLYIRSYLTNTVGPWPLADQDLQHIQKNLQQMGWGKGLPTNGVWSTNWNTSYTQYVDNLRTQQLGGASPGALPFGTVLNALNSLLPRQAATAVGAYITNLPHSVRQDISTLAGSAGGTYSNIFEHPGSFTHPFSEQHGAAAQSENEAAAAAQNLIPGTRVTPQQAYTAQSARTQLMDTLQVAGDLFAAHGLLRAGGAVATAARETNWTSLDAAAAQRGPGTIASKLFGPVVGDTRAPLLSRGAATNVPILRMTGPVADKIAGGDGYYYRARTILAAPYAVPGVKVLGTAVGQVGLAGAKIRAAGSAESLVGGQTSPLSDAIDKYQNINQFDQAVQNKLQFTAFGHTFRPGINTLAWVAYPQLDSMGTVSASIGRDVTQLNDAVQHAFGPTTGLGLSIERGVNWTKTGDQRLSYDDLVQMAGGPSHFAQFWTSKIFEHAAARLAEDEWSKMPAQEQAAMLGSGVDFQDRAAVMSDLANQKLHNAMGGDITDLLRSANEMVTDGTFTRGQWGGHSGFSKAIAAEIERSGMTPREWLQKYMVNYGEASRIQREVVIPRRNELVSDATSPADIGLAPIDYLFTDKATNEANQLEANYRAAVAALKARASGKPEEAAAPDESAGGVDPAIQQRYDAAKAAFDADLTDDKARQEFASAEEALRFARRTGGVAKKAAPAAESGADAWKNFEESASAIRQYLVDNFGIDGPAMPQNDEDMLKLLHQKADAQQSRLFPRQRALHIAPDDAKPALHPTLPAGSSTLDRFSATPVFTRVKPTQAMEIVHESRSPNLHQWTNNPQELEGGGLVTIEHDPKGLYGELDRSRGESGYDMARGVARFDAARNKTSGLDDIRSVELRSKSGLSGKQRTAWTLLSDQLDRAGYIKIDGENGGERWFRPDLMGGTIASSPEMQKALADLEKLGYAPTLGKGIGFGFYNYHTFDFADAHLTRSRRFFENLGLSPENQPAQDIGFTWNMNFHRRLLDAVENGDLKLYPTHLPETIIAMMKDGDALPPSPSVAGVIQHTIGKHAYDFNHRMLTDDLMAKGKSEKDAAVQAAHQLDQAIQNPQGFVHMTKDDLRKVLGRRPDENTPSEVQTVREAELRGIKTGFGGQPMYDDHAIDTIYKLIQQTNASMPARLVGWQKLENLTALGLSYMGKPIPGAVGRGLEYLPTRLVTLRNRARFTLSPEFAARRVIKVNGKIMLDGVPPTFHPMRFLMRNGLTAYKETMADLDRIMPELKNPNYDDGTQALYADDPWGIYNHRNYEAYAMYHWQQMGKTDTEIRQLLTKDFGYGSKAYGEGRSALERSANFVFFPFSFDKTLYRNTAAYLLDHTAQRLILQAGLEAYQRYNQSDPGGTKLMSSNWWLNHAPVIQEGLRLNAFAHGLGLGQFGGINAPLLNLFIPQSYASSSQGVSTLKGILPVMKEFQDLYKESTQTFKVGRQLVSDQFINIPTLKGFKSKADETEAQTAQGIFYAKPVAETDSAQLNDAYQYRRKLEALFKSYVDYNAHHTSKYKLPTNAKDIYGQWGGHTIDATLINYLTNQKYPAFPPDNPSIYYAQEAMAIDTYALQMQNQGHDEVVRWIADSQKIGTYIYNGKLDTAQAQVDTKIFRAYAIQFAETIPGFLTFYNKNFKWQYGPLEKVR